MLRTRQDEEASERFNAFIDSVVHDQGVQPDSYTVYLTAQKVLGKKVQGYLESRMDDMTIEELSNLTWAADQACMADRKKNAEEAHRIAQAGLENVQPLQPKPSNDPR